VFVVVDTAEQGSGYLGRILSQHRSIAVAEKHRPDAQGIRVVETCCLLRRGEKLHWTEVKA